MRKVEVDNYDDVQNFEELKTLLADPPQEMKVKYRVLRQPPPEYTELENAGTLPAWPGSRTLFRISCLPSNKSDIDRRNWKIPTVFILNNSTSNPLNCSDVFKTVAAMHCFNCPSVNGGISVCCHLGFLFLLLSAPFVLMESVKRPVKPVNLKNARSFLHPDEVLQNIRTIELPMSQQVIGRTRE